LGLDALAEASVWRTAEAASRIASLVRSAGTPLSSLPVWPSALRMALIRPVSDRVPLSPWPTMPRSSSRSFSVERSVSGCWLKVSKMAWEQQDAQSALGAKRAAEIGETTHNSPA
jgi:hypothetical protein